MWLYDSVRPTAENEKSDTIFISNDGKLWSSIDETCPAENLICNKNQKKSLDTNIVKYMEQIVSSIVIDLFQITASLRNSNILYFVWNLGILPSTLVANSKQLALYSPAAIAVNANPKSDPSLILCILSLIILGY